MSKDIDEVDAVAYHEALDGFKDFEGVLELVNLLDRLSNAGRVNDMRRALVPYIAQREQAAYEWGLRKGQATERAQVGRMGLSRIVEGNRYICLPISWWEDRYDAQQPHNEGEVK